MYKPQILVAYYCFATGDLSPGFDLLNSAIEQEDQLNHWIAYRVLLIRHLFNKAVWDNPLFQEILMKPGRDPDSREMQRQSVMELTPVTGIEAQPLMRI